jgi:hypothetical protein
VKRTRLVGPAKKTAREMNAWWRKHRQKAPKLFAEELRAIRCRIGEKPDLGQVYTVTRDGTVIRRILMPKTRTHVFYEDMPSEVMIVALWGAMKGTGPDLAG